MQIAISHESKLDLFRTKPYAAGEDRKANELDDETLSGRCAGDQ